MGTQIQPQNQPVQNDPDNLPPADDQQTPPNLTQSTENTQRVYTQEEVEARDRFFMQALQESERQRLEAQSARQQQVTSSPEEDAQLLLKSPGELIRREVQAAIAPMQREQQFYIRQSQYQQLRENASRLPQVAPYWDKISQYVDQIMLTVDPTPQNMQAAIQNAMGQLAMAGQLTPTPVQPRQQQPVNNQPITQQNTNNMLPPHLRPSAPPAPQGNVQYTQNGNPIRQLTELEDRVRRESRMTVEQYIDFLNAGASDQYGGNVSMAELQNLNWEKK